MTPEEWQKVRPILESARRPLVYLEQHEGPLATAWRIPLFLNVHTF
jgi:hypothetical protein